MLDLLYYCLAVIGVVVGVLLLVVTARIYLGRKLANDAYRGLFVFSDGVKTRSIDPIQVMLGLEAHPEFRLDRHLRLAREGDSEAVRITAKAAQDVFRVPEYTEPGKPGLTISECYRLMLAYIAFAESLKKNTKPSPIAPASTGPTSYESNSKTTNDSSPSGSCAAEPA